MVLWEERIELLWKKWKQWFMTKTSPCTYGMKKQEQPYICIIDYLIVLLDSRLLKRCIHERSLKWAISRYLVVHYMFILWKRKEPSWILPERRVIFVGYCEVSKSFRIYISGFHHIEISRDVIFDKEKSLKKCRKCQIE